MNNLISAYKQRFSNIVDATSDTITILLADGDTLTLTMDDVVEYYVSQAPNFSSGCREIGSIAGDWRPIDQIAKFCLAYFREINKEAFVQILRDRGLTPKFA